MINRLAFLKELHRDIDADNRELLTRINGIVQCPDCGLWHPLVQRTAAWNVYLRPVQTHKRYGPARCVCDCGTAIVDDGQLRIDWQACR